MGHMDAMEIEEQVESITRLAVHTVASLRNFCLQQKDLWQKIPHLALRVDERFGYNDFNNTAYSRGYLGLGASINSDGKYSVYVDLETGALVNAANPQELAGEKNVLMLAFTVHRLNAEKIISYIEAQISGPTAKILPDPAKQATWRRSMEIRYGLNPNTYARKKAVPEVYDPTTCFD